MGFSEMFSYPVYRYKKPSGRSVLIRLVDMGFNGIFSDLHCNYTGSIDESGLRLVDTSFNGMFSKPLSRYTGSTG